MPTAEQMVLRREKILEQVDLLRKGETTPAKVPYNLRTATLAAALAEKVITAEDVAPKIARDVALTFLKEASTRERDTAADKGTEVHKLADALSMGEKIHIPDALRNHIYSWQQWRDDWGMKFLETEFTVYSPDNDYAGTGDFIGESELRPELDIICGDYKTSESGIWPDIALQLAAIRYAKFIDRLDGSQDHDTLKRIKSFVGVQITDKGYKVVPVHVTEGTYRVFLAAADVARWKREYEQFALGAAEFVTRKELTNG